MKPVYIDCSDGMRRLLTEHGWEQRVIVHDGDPTREQLAALIADARVVLNGHTMIDAGLLARAPHLQSIVFLGTGASSYILSLIHI